ncbi:unnamed protein product, partial [Dicrocoelium dendriticum]
MLSSVETTLKVSVLPETCKNVSNGHLLCSTSQLTCKSVYSSLRCSNNHTICFFDEMMTKLSQVHRRRTPWLFRETTSNTEAAIH